MRSKNDKKSRVWLSDDFTIYSLENNNNYSPFVQNVQSKKESGAEKTSYIPFSLLVIANRLDHSLADLVDTTWQPK